MKTVKIIYNKSEISISLYFISFFRLNSIYVAEEFWGKRMLEALRNENAKSDEWNDYEDYDCYLCIISNQGDYADFKRFEKDHRLKKIIVISEIPVSIGYTCIDANAQADKLLFTLLTKLKDLEIISPNSFEELASILKVFDSLNYVKWFFLLKYFYKTDKLLFAEIKANMQVILRELLKLMQHKNCNWGSSEMLYTQAACIRLIYELNVYCKKYGESVPYNSETLLAICKKLDESALDQLGNSIKVLLGSIYRDLFANPNKAYECYIESCDEKYRYDAYVYFLKAYYWLKNSNNNEKAIMYLLIAVKIYPEYYRAWYRLGVCYLESTEYSKALVCLENVVRCLSERWKKNRLRPLEFDFLIKSCILMAKIWIEGRDYSSALNCLTEAENIYNSIDDSEFYDIIFQGTDIGKLKELTKKRLPWIYARDLMGMLYEMTGNSEKAKEYQMMKELINGGGKS